MDPDLLQTFLAFVDGGSLARAASVVGRTPSAVTAQMQRLEETVGGAILAPAGRGRVLTPLGEDLVIHARRILDANREAWLALKGASADGRVAIGATQDFADIALPPLLRTFARTHPRVRLDLRIGRTAELVRALEDGAVDVLIAMRGEPSPDEVGVVREPMIWLVAADGLTGADPELPLALLEPPCGFRTAAIAALEAGHRRFRIAASSGSLSGLCTAVRAGIALTLRTPRLIGSGISEAPAHLELPSLPAAEFSIRRRSDASQPAVSLAELVCDALGAVQGWEPQRP